MVTIINWKPTFSVYLPPESGYDMVGQWVIHDSGADTSERTQAIRQSGRESDVCGTF
jgi:hypothetical protein